MGNHIKFVIERCMIEIAKIDGHAHGEENALRPSAEG